MKLTNAQIASIIDKAKEVNRNLIKKDEENLRKLATPGIEKELKQLSKELDSCKNVISKMRDSAGSYYKDKIKKEKILENYKDHLFRKIHSKIPTIDANSLENDIILASIDAKDLNELCTRLKIKLN